MPSILIVDDEQTIRQLFQYVFAEAGYAVHMAANGQEALEQLERLTPDFMLVDISMPVMTGPEFIAGLRKRAVVRPELRNIPFLVMTGENFMDEKINRFFTDSPGFVSFLPKMTDPEQVLATVQNIVGKGGKSKAGGNAGLEMDSKWPWEK